MCFIPFTRFTSNDIEIIGRCARSHWQSKFYSKYVQWCREQRRRNDPRLCRDLHAIQRTNALVRPHIIKSDEISQWVQIQHHYVSTDIALLWPFPGGITLSMRLLLGLCKFISKLVAVKVKHPINKHQFPLLVMELDCFQPSFKRIPKLRLELCPALPAFYEIKVTLTSIIDHV